MSSPRPLPDWLLERLALGESTSHRLGGANVASEVDRLRAEDAAFLREHPPEEWVPRIQARARQQRPRKVWAAGFLVAALAVAVTVVFLPAPSDGIRLKGLEPTLRIYRKGKKGTEELSDGSRVRAGDVVQVRYVAAGRPYGLILSVDGASQVTLHWPENPGLPARLQPSGETTLPRAYQLDSAPIMERFVLVTSSHPLETESVMAAVRTWAAQGFTSSRPAIPANAQAVVLTLWKDIR